jgi:hypothetical protein
MDLRQGVLDRLARLYHDDVYETGMMQAFLIGQSFQLQRVWTEIYRNTGTFHVIVISGTHVAILAAFFLFLLRICFVPESLALFITVLAAWLCTDDGMASSRHPLLRPSSLIFIPRSCGLARRRIIRSGGCSARRPRKTMSKSCP